MIENNNNNRICDTCSKEDVCMYKEELKKTVKDITQILKCKNLGNEFIDADIKCKKWLGTISVMRSCELVEKR